MKMKFAICSFNNDAFVATAALGNFAMSNKESFGMKLSRPDEVSRTIGKIIEDGYINDAAIVGFQLIDQDMDTLVRGNMNEKSIGVVDFRGWAFKAQKKYRFVRYENNLGTAQIMLKELERKGYKCSAFDELGEVVSLHSKSSTDMTIRDNALFAATFFDMFGIGGITMLASDPNCWQTNPYSTAVVRKIRADAMDVVDKIIPIGPGIFIVPGKCHSALSLSIIGERAFEDDTCEMLVSVERQGSGISFSACSKTRKAISLMTCLREKYNSIPGTTTPDTCAGKVSLAACASEKSFISMISQVWCTGLESAPEKKTEPKFEKMEEHKDHLSSTIGEILGASVAGK